MSIQLAQTLYLYAFKHFLMFPNRIKYHFTIFFNVVKLPAKQGKQKNKKHSQTIIRHANLPAILLVTNLMLLTFIIPNTKLVSITVPGINLER